MNQVQGLRLTSKAERLLAWRKVQEVQPKFVIIDSCERVVPSETFTSKELDELIRFVRACTSHGIAVAVIDHTTKNTQGRKTVEALYGARAKSAAADVMIQLSGDLKKPSGVRATWTKERGSPTPPHEIHLEATEEGMRFTIVSTVTKATTPSQKRVVTYLTSLRSDERTKEQIATRLKLSEKTAKRALDPLVTNGVVRRRNQRQADGSKLAFYSIPCAVDEDDLIVVDNDAA